MELSWHKEAIACYKGFDQIKATSAVLLFVTLREMRAGELQVFSYCFVKIVKQVNAFEGKSINRIIFYSMRQKLVIPYAIEVLLFQAVMIISIVFNGYRLNRVL